MEFDAAFVTGANSGQCSVCWALAGVSDVVMADDSAFEGGVVVTGPSEQPVVIFLSGEWFCGVPELSVVLRRITAWFS
jgi:hypothetical protein